MVTKKSVKKVSGYKNEILAVVSILMITSFLVFVFAATAFVHYDNANGKSGNYTGFLYLNISSTINTSHASATTEYNVTYYYNASGGTANVSSSAGIANVGNLTGVMSNQSSDSNSSAFNITADISGLADGTTYNISVYINNVTYNESASIHNITIDNTGPNVTFIPTNITNNANYTSANIFVINVSVNDATIGMNASDSTFGTNAGNVYINVSNSSGGHGFTDNWTRATNVTQLAGYKGAFYNISINFSAYDDGRYNITIWANDSAYLNITNVTDNLVQANLNNTERIQITIDDTAPTITIVNTTSTTTTSIVATITGVDTWTGIKTCTADSSSGWTVTGAGTTSQTLTHTGLSCGTEYSYIITCKDHAGNAGSSASTKLSTSPCSTSGGSSPSGGGTSESTWTQTFIVTAEQFEEGYNRKIGENRRAKLSVGSETHYVGVKSLTATSATIEISSDPVTVQLDIGEDAKVDVNDDGYYNVYVKLNGIVDGEADLTIKSIYEEVPADVGTGVETSGEIIGAEEDEGIEDLVKGKTWIWWIIGIVLVLIVAGIVLKKKK